ncbi:TetR/AcrR family transcriptional regulator [Actinomadura logoneensis]|uniref:TetR/AcrR family transcriptional regulator n=1 Tax=Actinomadura logoneensis TaxID=2293572 RepID=A0A372JEZ2_9ACTN|nr:TetR/AcrR family transcriptional regulator [Actinomadura logoneensis]RFU38567.1 TetR/AcrR family transcriptional regulator [Actinomadura logoneensis]
MTETRRGRPRAFDRDAALASATRLFWERGYEATSIGDLTEAMGIRPASLYAAFGDKKALFKEVVQGYQRTEWADFVGRAFDEEPTVYRGFARALREAAEIYTDPSHPAGCLVIRAATNVAPRDAEIETYLRDIRNANVAAFADRVREGVRRGELPDDTDPRAVAQLFALVLQGLSQRAGDGATAADLRPAVEMVLAAWPGSRE